MGRKPKEITTSKDFVDPLIENGALQDIERNPQDINIEFVQTAVQTEQEHNSLSELPLEQTGLNNDVKDESSNQVIADEIEQSVDLANLYYNNWTHLNKQVSTALGEVIYGDGYQTKTAITLALEAASLITELQEENDQYRRLVAQFKIPTNKIKKNTNTSRRDFKAPAKR